MEVLGSGSKMGARPRRIVRLRFQSSAYFPDCNSGGASKPPDKTILIPISTVQSVLRTSSSGNIWKKPLVGLGVMGMKQQTSLPLEGVSACTAGVPADVVKVGVYLAEGADFARMNEVYAEFFGENKPVRTTIVCKFVADIKIEVDCIAYTPAT